MQKKYAHWTYLHTPVGWLVISGNGAKIAQVDFIDHEPTSFYTPVPDYLTRAAEQLQEYFDGKRQTFELELDLREATDFQRRVWELLLKIPYGHTSSYQRLAIELGDAKAIRAVGGAASQNPIAIIVPCHRLIGSDGSLTGFAGGLHRKEFLLSLERPSVFGEQTALF